MPRIDRSVPLPTRAASSERIAGRAGSRSMPRNVVGALVKSYGVSDPSMMTRPLPEGPTNARSRAVQENVALVVKQPGAPAHDRASIVADGPRHSRGGIEVVPVATWRAEVAAENRRKVAWIVEVMIEEVAVD